MYDTNKEDIIIDEPVINASEGVITVNVSSGADLLKVFATCKLSSGATIYPSIGGYQDWSSKSRTFKVVSASETREKTWTINILSVEE